MFVDFVLACFVFYFFSIGCFALRCPLSWWSRGSDIFACPVAIGVE
jgi:hypothetical protein